MLLAMRHISNETDMVRLLYTVQVQAALRHGTGPLAVMPPIVVVLGLPVARGSALLSLTSSLAADRDAVPSMALELPDWPLAVALLVLVVPPMTHPPRPCAACRPDLALQRTTDA